MGCHPSFSTMDSRPQPMTCLVGVPPAIEAPRHCLRCFAQTSLNAVDAVSGHHPPKGSLIVSKHCFGCRKARPPQLPHVTCRRACRSSSRRSASAGARTATVAATVQRSDVMNTKLAEALVDIAIRNLTSSSKKASFDNCMSRPLWGYNEVLDSDFLDDTVQFPPGIYSRRSAEACAMARR